MLVFVILVGHSDLTRSADQRSMQTFEDAENIPDESRSCTRTPGAGQHPDLGYGPAGVRASADERNAVATGPAVSTRSAWARPDSCMPIAAAYLARAGVHLGMQSPRNEADTFPRTAIIIPMNRRPSWI